MLTCPPNVTINNTPGQCNNNTYAVPPATYNDNCPPVSGPTNNAPTTFPLGLTTVIFTATQSLNGSNQQVSCAMTVRVVDNQAPNISCPPDQTVSTNVNCTYTLNTPNATISDNCTTGLSQSHTPLAPYSLGANTITYKATDGAGNTTTCNMILTVEDNQNPTITCPTPATIVVNTAPGVCEASPPLGTPTVGDNCGVATVDISPDPPFPVGTTVVIYTVFDNSGNTNSCTRTFVVQDKEIPTAICPSNITVDTDPGECTADFTLPDPATDDNCGVNFITNNAPSPFPKGVRTVTFTVTDIYGNTKTCTTVVTVEDNEAPEIQDCPESQEVSANQNCQAVVILQNPFATDNCPGAIQYTRTPTGNIFQLGTTEVIFTATDLAGNQSTCSAEITVVDDTPPTLDCPNNITLQTAPNECVGYAFPDEPIFSDNCDDFPDLFSTPNNPTGAWSVGVNLITFFAYDDAGLEGTCTMTITVQDVQPPTISCPPNLTASTGSGSCVAVVNIPPATASDNCPNSLVITNPPSPQNFGVGTFTLNYSATDGTFTTSCSITLMVSGSSQFSIDCPDDLTVSTDPNECFSSFDLPDATVVSDCGPATLTNDAPANLPVGTTTVIFTATTSTGDTVTCSTTVVVEDTQIATLTCPQNITQATDPGSCTADVTVPAPIFSENCPAGWTFPTSDTTLQNLPVGILTLNFTATNGLQNTSCSVVVEVTGSSQFSINCPPNTTVSTDPDQCFSSFNLPDATVVSDCGPATLSNDAPANFPVGTTTVIFTATLDNGSGSTSCSTTVTVEDNQAAQLTCPQNITVPTDTGSCTADVTVSAPVFSENCPSGWTFPTSDTTLQNLPVGTLTLNFTATNGSQNTSCSVVIEVTGTSQFSIACPPPQTVDVPQDSCEATVNLDNPTVISDCGDFILTSDPTLPFDFPIGTTTVVFTATLVSGGATTSCSTTVTVNDSQPPTLTCDPNPITVATDPDGCTADVLVPAPIFLENCPANWTFPTADSLVNDLPIGTSDIVFFASDGTTTLSCSVAVTVNDSTPPEIQCPASPISLAADAGTCSVDSLFSAFATDNCTQNLNTTANPASPYSIGTQTITLTATDDAGNSATCQIELTVLDIEPPTLDCPDNISANTDAGECFATLDFSADISLNDACGTASLQAGSQTSGQFPTGNSTVNLIADDGNGNSATCQIQIQVIDNEPPTLTCPPDLTQNIDASGCQATVVFGQGSAVDNCAGNVPLTGPTGGTYGIGMHSEIFTATDGTNSATCEVKITITGTTNLTMTCPADFEVANDAGECSAVVALPDPTDVVADCGFGGISNSAVQPFPIGETTVIFTLTDQSGGVFTCSTTVTVADTTAPQLVCPADFSLSANTGNCEAVANFAAAQVLDNCPLLPQNLTADPPSGSLLPVGMHPVQFSYTAADGSTATCQFEITVNDSPTFSTQNLSACEGDTISFGGQNFTESGSFSINLTNSAGCDSILNLILDFSPLVIRTASAAICEGKSILLGGAQQTTAGVYEDRLPAKTASECDTLLRTTLSINPKPQVEIMGPLTLCPGTLATLTAGVFSGFLWSPGGLTTPTISIDQPGNYSVVVTDTKGCTNSDAIQIDLNCGTVAADFEADRDTICTDFFIKFSDKSTGMPDPPTAWLWDFGNGNFSNQQNPFTYYPTPGTYTVKLTVTGNGGVSSTIEKPVVIYKKIEANFSHTAPDICQPTELIFKDLSQKTFPLKTWSWDFGDGNFSSQPDPTHQYNFYDTVSVSLAVVDIFGCTDSVKQVVEVSPNGIAPLPVYLDKTLCAGETFTLNGVVFDQNHLRDTVILISQKLCDSVVIVQVSFLPGGNLDLGDTRIICENQSVMLDAGAGGGSYKWSNGATSQTILVSAAGIYSVSITSSSGDCAASGEVEVKVDTIPNIASNAGSDFQICFFTQKIVQLDAFPPLVGTGEWTTSSGATIDNPTTSTSFLTNLPVGKSQFTWTLSNGACKNYSSDVMEIEAVNLKEFANSGPDIAFCLSGDLKMKAEPAPPGTIGTWVQKSGPNPLNIAELNNPNTVVSGLTATGIYQLSWTIDNGVCPDASSDLLISRSSSILTNANAGDDETLCDEDFAILDGNLVIGTTGFWTHADTTNPAKILNPISGSADVIDLPRGATKFVWTLSTSECPNYDTDTVIIFNSRGLHAMDDGYFYSTQPLTNLNFLDNDSIGSANFVFFNVPPTTSIGTLTRNLDGSYNFDFGKIEPITVVFEYEICLKTCPDVCSKAKVIIKANSNDEILNPNNVITPNGDNYGEYFSIPNYDKIAPNIFLTVVNRWGDVVFTTGEKHYDNRWQGTDSNGNPLPDGTYFYVLRGGGGKGFAKGSVTILR